MLHVELVQTPRPVLPHADVDGDAGRTQRGDTPPRDRCVWVDHGGNNAAWARRDQRVGARGCPPLMRARFERHEDVRAPGGLPRRGECLDLGVRGACPAVKTGRDHHTVPRDHAAHHRIGARGEVGGRRRREGGVHQRLVGAGAVGHARAGTRGGESVPSGRRIRRASRSARS